MQAYLLGDADPKHAPPKVRTNQGQLDIVARSFGYLDGGNVFAGLIRFSDAELGTQPSDPAPSCRWPAEADLRCVLSK